MTQRRNRSLDSLKATWSTESKKKTTAPTVSQPATTSHTKVVSKGRDFSDLPRAKPQLSVGQNDSPRPKKKPSRKDRRIYLNVVLSADVEKRLERAVQFFQRSHGKAFGKSAYGRKALLAQLERDGF